MYMAQILVERHLQFSNQLAESSLLSECICNLVPAKVNQRCQCNFASDLRYTGSKTKTSRIIQPKALFIAPDPTQLN